MTDTNSVVLPRRIKDVLVGRDERSIHVTWNLGEVASAHPVEHFLYSVTITGNRGSTLKQFGVKFIGTEDPEIVAFVHDFILPGGQANYDSEHVSVSRDAISVHFIDASVGPDKIDAATSDFNVNGVDLQERLPVTFVG